MSNQSKVKIHPKYTIELFRWCANLIQWDLIVNEPTKKIHIAKIYVYTFNYILWVTNAWYASGANVDLAGECTIQYG